MAEREKKEETMTMRGKLLVCALGALMFLAGVVGTQPAQAAFGFVPGPTGFDGTTKNQDGSASTQAGAHPFSATTSFKLNSASNAIGELVPDGGSLKDIEVDLPAGFVGNPEATPTKCTYAQLSETECPVSSQVGTNTLTFSFGFPFSIALPVYAMEPPPGYPAMFGFRAFVVNQTILTKIRTGEDYGVTAVLPNISQGLAVLGSSLSLWGVPADPAHDPERLCPDETKGCASDAAPTPFLTNPGNCSAGPQSTTIAADSWNSPGAFETRSFVSHDTETPPNPVGPSGCESVPFTPSVTIAATSTEAASPTGLDVEIHLPQSENPDGLSTAHLKRTVVTLPEGVAVNPSASNGLGACSASQIDLDGPGPANCPDSSKVGSVQIDTPVLDHPLNGSVYLAKQGENKFGSLLAMYIAVDDPETGVILKLPGRIQTDTVTGRITATFDDSPQLPFEDLRLRLFGGPRASLITPQSCGSYTARAELSSWSAADPDTPTTAEIVPSTSSFRITSGPGGGPCPNGSFSPSLSAGTTNPAAGKSSPFVLSLNRDDGTQLLGGLVATLPEGLLASLKDVPYCPEAALAAVSGAEGAGTAQIASPSCPVSSQVGTVTVGAGAGDNPIQVNTGRAYLAGPYKGAPLSLAVIAPAVAGPFDLGNVLVRNALRIDPVTAQVTAASDPIPSILHGIPLALREVRVALDRPDFTLNPTSCDPMAISGIAISTIGQSAPVSDRFQVADCASLAFKPKLAMRLHGAPPRRGGFPALKAVLSAPKGEANIGKATVLMPKTELLEQGHIRTICTREQWAADNCPKGSIYGNAKAFTPLLDKPLEGNVYLRSNGGARELPDLVADLKGQIDIELVGYIDAVNARLRARFLNVPDAPVSKFVLQMQGGKKGLLAHNTNVCKTTPRASVKFEGQNGKAKNFNPKVAVGGCGKKGN